MNGVPLDRPTSRLTWLYIAALTAVAVLSLTGQMLVQRSLRQQRGDSTIVNLAGRQRMLSQKLTKAALAWNYATQPEDRAERSEEIRSTLSLWQRTHHGLQYGDSELSLVANRSPTVVAQFEKLQPIFEEMVVAAEHLLAATDKAQQQQQLNILLACEPQFLASMDAVVFQLDREAQTRVARLQQIEWLLLTLALLVLVCEGYLVFRPAVQRIRQAAQELQVAKEAAESANEQKTRFLATISHELRNPLHAILGNAELALGLPLVTQQRNYVATINESAQSLLQLVNDLLDFACIQAGKLRVQLSPFDLRSVVQRCAAMVQPLAHRKGLRFTTELPLGELVVQGDALRVQQVLLNLLGNAVKFTDEGQIRLNVVKQENVLRIEIKDTGPGIPAAMQQTIFAAFTQVDGSTRREFSGVGLGLAISVGLVELMQGRIGLESEPARGSCFWFELALSSDSPQRVESTVPANQVAEGTGCRVLVAEDDAVNRRLLADFLQVLGHQVVLAADGSEASEFYAAGQFDLVLLDWHMPQIDGLDLARQIRKLEADSQRPRVPLIAISAAAAIAETQQAHEAGVDEVLLKPIGLEQLRQALQPFTNASRWQSVLARMQGNFALLRDLATIFLEQLPDDLKQLAQLVAESKFRELERAAHLLKGQAANFDAVALVTATADLENAAAAESLPRVNEHWQRVQTAADQLQGELRSLLNQRTTSRPIARA